MRGVVLVAIGVMLLATPGSARAREGDDRVTLSSFSGIGSVILTGRVVDWTGRSLRIRVAEDRIREIDSERVEAVETPRLPAHIAGVAALEAGNFDDARKQLEKALPDEPRAWMRREILAELTRADLAQGDRLAATDCFLAICRSDPETFWFDRIPLEWRIEGLTFDDSARVAEWMKPGASEVSQLIGASYALFDPARHASAENRLKQLAASTDPRVYHVARAQLWRRMLHTRSVSKLDVERWSDRIREIPVSLRGGPRFLLGHGYAELGNPGQAAANWLWLPLVHAQDRCLAAEAELLAARQLEKVGKGTEAIVLYREVIERFGQTPSRALAEKALAEISGQKGDATGPSLPREARRNEIAGPQKN